MGFGSIPWRFHQSVSWSPPLIFFLTNVCACNKKKMNGPDFTRHNFNMRGSPPVEMNVVTINLAKNNYPPSMKSCKAPTLT